MPVLKTPATLATFTTDGLHDFWRNDIDHVMTCKKGGYVSMRHNVVRDVEAKLMQSVCSDVRTEPELIPTTEEAAEGNTAVKARLDISSVGMWSRCARTFFDVRITHPNAASHLRKSLPSLYKENESQKKNAYNDRVLNVEKACFVFTTTALVGWVWSVRG